MRALALMMLVAGIPAIAQDLPFSDRRWVLGGDSTRVENVNGREALRMYGGTATRRDVALEDGTIDFDVMTSKRRSFVYARFRMVDQQNMEEFYLRPHKTELPDATQYAPVFRGQSAWQLYHGERGTSSPAIEPGVWQHVRIVLRGQRMAVFFGDTVTPTLDVPMARTPVAGYFQLAGFIPAGTPGTGAIAWFSNVRVRPGVIAYAFRERKPAPLPSGVIAKWTVSPAFMTKDIAPVALDPKWLAGGTVVDIEPNGMVALNRWLPMPADFAPAARLDVGTVARFVITAASASLRAIEIGFSDAVTVFLNGQPVFHGDDSYLFAQRRDGLIGFDQARVYLPLKAGRNEVSLFVTDHFGGMGVMARLLDTRGLVVPP